MVDEKDLQLGLDPDLDYFDATPSIEVLAQELLKLQQSMRRQLSVNIGLIRNMQMLNERMVELEQPKSSIILPN